MVLNVTVGYCTQVILHTVLNLAYCRRKRVRVHAMPSPLDLRQSPRHLHVQLHRWLHARRHAHSYMRWYRTPTVTPYSNLLDIDECALDMYDCAEGRVCQNTVGSYTCVDNCGTGYTLVDGKCADVGELPYT